MRKGADYKVVTTEWNGLSGTAGDGEDTKKRFCCGSY